MFAGFSGVNTAHHGWVPATSVTSLKWSWEEMCSNTPYAVFPHRDPVDINSFKCIDKSRHNEIFRKWWGLSIYYLFLNIIHLTVCLYNLIFNNGSVLTTIWQDSWNFDTHLSWAQYKLVLDFGSKGEEQNAQCIRGIFELWGEHKTPGSYSIPYSGRRSALNGSETNKWTSLTITITKSKTKKVSKIFTLLA